jgi:hypothetical protein
MLDRVWQTVDVTGAELLLLLSYADICDDQGNGIWCSDEYTMWKTGIGRSTLVATKKKWREMGVLYPVGFYHIESKQSIRADVNATRGVGGRGWTILYQLCLDPLPAKTAWKEGRAKKVPISGTFNTGQKVPVDGTFEDSKGADGWTERCQPLDEKVPISGREGAETHQRNKEEPLVEPLGNPLGERKAAPLSESVLVIARQRFWECYRQTRPNPDLDPDADEYRRLGAATTYSGLDRTTVKKEVLLKDLRFMGWKYAAVFDSQQEIAFPQPAAKNGHQPKTWAEILGPEQFNEARELAIEYLKARGTKAGAEMRQRIGRAIRTMSVDGIDEFIEEVEHGESA